MMVRKKLIDDSGYATIASSGIIIAVVVLLAAVAVIISRVVAFHQAQVAADMAAISGAYSLARGGRRLRRSRAHRTCQCRRPRAMYGPRS